MPLEPTRYITLSSSALIRAVDSEVAVVCRDMLQYDCRSLALALLLVCQVSGISAVVMLEMTNQTEAEALQNMVQNIFPMEVQQLAHGLYDNIDPCGVATCQPRGLIKCAWIGISCNSWRVTGVQIQSSSLLRSVAALSQQKGSLAFRLGDLSQLRILQLADLG